MKKHKRITASFMALLLLFSALLPIQVFSSESEPLTLTVSYDAKCGEPSVFTVNAGGGSGNYLYLLNNITRDGEDGQYFIMDPSRLPGYKTDNTFEVTFYASGVYYLHFYVMDKGSSPIVTKRKIIKVSLNDPEYPTVETVADQIATQCAAVCKTDYERALWLHDWLVDHCEYDYSYLYCNPEGALVRGTGTCEAYHRAYTMLLRRVGIASGRIEGNGHVWTAVYIDGNWYQVDVTWDDNGYSDHTYENYLYFGLNDTIMNMVHSDHSPNDGYISDSLANNYFIKSGLIHNWSDALEDSIQTNLQTGAASFDIPVTSNMPAGYQDVIYNLAAYQLSTQEWENETHTVKINANYSAGQMKINASYTPIHTHTWDNGTITKEPTISSDGIKTYTCTICGATKTETITITRLQTPTAKAVVNANGGFTISWNAVSGADKYDVYIDNGTGYKLLRTVTGTSTTTGTAHYGKKYAYKVRAVNSKNSAITSAFSSAVTATNTKKLVTPTAKAVVNANGGFTISWNAVSGADKYDVYIDNGTGYKLLRTVTGTSTTTGTAHYGKKYAYKVRAVNSKNSAITSAFSSAVSAINNKKLVTPIPKIKVNSNASFTLSWNTVIGADTYEIYLKTANGSYRLLKTVNTNSATIGGAVKGKTYTYKVRAVNSKNSTVTSAFSSELSGIY